MAYDADLADRLRERLAARTDVTEKRMFGGLAFLVGGRMTVCADNRGGLLTRVDPAHLDDAAREPGTDRFVMPGRQLAGWLAVDPGALTSDVDLARWVDGALAYVATLPAR